VPLVIEQLFAEALGEREGDLRELVRGVVDQELRRVLGTIIDEELAARQNGDEPEAEPTPPRRGAA
jgi:hypothetical protein